MEDSYDKFSEKKLLTVKQMCEYMSIGESTARKMLSEPNCTFVCRIGGRIYANRTMLDKYINANTGRKNLSGFIKK